MYQHADFKLTVGPAALNFENNLLNHWKAPHNSSFSDFRLIERTLVVRIRGLNGVKQLQTKGKKYCWLPTKRAKNNRLATKKLTEIYRKILTDNRQSNEILTHNRHVDPPPPFRPSELCDDIQHAITALINIFFKVKESCYSIASDNELISYGLSRFSDLKDLCLKWYLR